MMHAISARTLVGTVAEASDPATPPERLDELIRSPKAEVVMAARMNPNLSERTLKKLLSSGMIVEAWANPALPLLLLMEPDNRELIRGAVKAGQRLRGYEALYPTLRETLAPLAQEWWLTGKTEKTYEATIERVESLGLALNVSNFDPALLARVTDLLCFFCEYALGCAKTAAPVVREAIAAARRGSPFDQAHARAAAEGRKLNAVYQEAVDHGTSEDEHAAWQELNAAEAAIAMLAVLKSAHANEKGGVAAGVVSTFRDATTTCAIPEADLTHFDNLKPKQVIHEERLMALVLKRYPVYPPLMPLFDDGGHA